MVGRSTFPLRAFTSARLPTQFIAMASVSDVPNLVKSVLRIDAFVAALKPAEVSLDAFNSQYLRRHSSSASTMLTSSQVSHVWDAPSEEVENLLLRARTGTVRSTELDVWLCFVGSGKPASRSGDWISWLIIVLIISSV